MRKTKIICTLGPSTEDDSILEAMVQEGMNVVRLNFSHGTHEGHEKNIRRVRGLSEKHDIPIAVLLDTKGPEIRTGELKEKKIFLKSGQTFTLYAKQKKGDTEGVSISFPDLYQDVHEGAEILLDDGLIALKVMEIKDKDIVCQVGNDGWLSERKGINVPNIHLNMPYMSERDKNDILFGIGQKVDFIAASFVRTEEDVKELRQFLNENGGQFIRVMSKIENKEGIQNIDAIIAASDAIMVARGDMGVELPPEELPAIQKMIIRKVYEAGKQVVTATQMLDSMMKNPRPTRAETTDVANAIYDGTTAIMLSGESAAGAYPIESVQTMSRIAERTEQEVGYEARFHAINYGCEVLDNREDVTTAISHACCATAMDLKASAIITVTMSGFTANKISRYQPECMVIGCTVDESVYRQLSLLFGVMPLLIQKEDDTEKLFDAAINASLEAGLIHHGDRVVLTAGVPLGVAGNTNMIRVVEV